MAKLESSLIHLSVISLLLVGCQVKTFSSVQEFSVAIYDIITFDKMFEPIKCPPDRLKLSSGNIELCFATILEPLEFVSKIDPKLKEFSELYNPWTEDYATTYAEFRTMNKKFIASFNYVPKNVSDYIQNGKVIALRLYPPLENFKAYLSVIVSPYQQ